MKTVFATLLISMICLLSNGQTRIYLLENGKVETTTKSQSKLFNKAIDSLEYYCVNANSFTQMQGLKYGELVHGEAVFYDAVGNIIEKGNFKNGLKHGTWIKWNKKGELTEVINWKNGLKHGINKKIGPNRTVETGKWKKNAKIGLWKTVENGTTIETKNYSKRYKNYRREFEKVEFQEKKDPNQSEDTKDEKSVTNSK